MQNVVGFLVLFVLIFLGLKLCSPSEDGSAHRSGGEAYRLVHATGNSEKFVAKGLSRRECEARKKEYKATASALGVYNESLGIGSITCLPESLF